MMDKIKILYEKYNFDYIFINPKSVKFLKWEFISEEFYSDYVGKPGYLGSIEINDKLIEAYQDKKVPLGEILFKFNDIRKERSVKLSEIIK